MDKQDENLPGESAIIREAFPACCHLAEVEKKAENNQRHYRWKNKHPMKRYVHDFLDSEKTHERHFQGRNTETSGRILV